MNIPGHEPILKNILIKDKDAIAIEVPIWNEERNKEVTGHIDLVQIENDVVCPNCFSNIFTEPPRKLLD